MRCAVISDIHSNFVALERVLEDIESRGIGEIYCLGDVVGYGPEPRRCLDLVRSVCKVVLRGNHDEAVYSAPFGFNRYARRAVEWSKEELDPQNYGEDHPLRGLVEGLWEFLAGMELTHLLEGEGVLMLHASPRDPLSEYILEKDIYSPPGGKLDQIFAQFDRLLFVGHSHMPGIFLQGRRYISPVADEPVRLEGKCIVNVGSVGQPRDFDPRACWVEVRDWEEVVFRRVEYDVDLTYRKVRQTGKLDMILGARIKIGV